MKFDERLTVGGTQYRLIQRDIMLLLSDAGRATFRVESKTQPRGQVKYECGYARHQFHPFFLGYIERAQQESNKSWTLHCRELVHGLIQIANISLRQCLITDVLRDVTTATRVQFAPVGAGKQVPRYASQGEGFNAVRNIARVFAVPDFVFYQQTDGMVWLGEWKTSAYATPDRVIDERFFTRRTPDAAVLPAMPKLRPGMLINGKRLLSHRLTQQHESYLKWMKS